MILETIDHAIAEAEKHGWRVSGMSVGTGLYPQFIDEVMRRGGVARETANKTYKYKGISVYLAGEPFMLYVAVSL